MRELNLPAPAVQCRRCSTQLPPAALACPSCATLVHRVRLQELAAAAGAASASGDGERAKALWDQARTLVPIESGQYRVLTKRIEHDVAPAASRGLPAGPPERWGLRAGETIAAAALLLARKLRGCWRA